MYHRLLYSRYVTSAGNAMEAEASIQPHPNRHEEQSTFGGTVFRKSFVLRAYVHRSWLKLILCHFSRPSQPVSQIHQIVKRAVIR
jgi:hypothetical protein